MTDTLFSVSWSQVKTRRRCEKQWAYKYLERLQPKEKKRAPYLGNWLHRALETYYESGDWRIGHKEYLE
ncbi:MAG TPA: PD-(D/E)XK nuclease family protein, partial [Patescibacteria group bacterium]|nr:PD-(D/E)XK nuclease family protein [Patescibacteria group bacterium]